MNATFGDHLHFVFFNAVFFICAAFLAYRCFGYGRIAMLFVAELILFFSAMIVIYVIEPRVAGPRLMLNIGRTLIVHSGALTPTAFDTLLNLTLAQQETQLLLGANNEL